MYKIRRSLRKRSNIVIVYLASKVAASKIKLKSQFLVRKDASTLFVGNSLWLREYFNHYRFTKRKRDKTWKNLCLYEIGVWFEYSLTAQQSFIHTIL